MMIKTVHWWTINVHTKPNGKKWTNVWMEVFIITTVYSTIIILNSYLNFFLSTIKTQYKRYDNNTISKSIYQTFHTSISTPGLTLAAATPAFSEQFAYATLGGIPRQSFSPFLWPTSAWLKPPTKSSSPPTL